PSQKFDHQSAHVIPPTTWVSSGNDMGSIATHLQTTNPWHPLLLDRPVPAGRLILPLAPGSGIPDNCCWGQTSFLVTRPSLGNLPYVSFLSLTRLMVWRIFFTNSARMLRPSVTISAWPAIPSVRRPRNSPRPASCHGRGKGTCGLMPKVTRTCLLTECT